MSDPAEVAANRVAQQVTHQIYYHHMLDAAREALKPIRNLHRAIPVPAANGAKVCHTCCDSMGDWSRWPCVTARLVYSSEELS